ncbi:MAG: TIGR02466 family protein, partial [Maricaulaceae bacterium]
PGAFFSGVYYLSAKTTAGAIEFYDPVAARTMTPVPATTKTSDNGGSVQFAPEPGVGLIFPAWLQHAVLANESGEDRVSISFNFLHQRKPPKTA